MNKNFIIVAFTCFLMSASCEPSEIHDIHFTFEDVANRIPKNSYHVYLNREDMRVNLLISKSPVVVDQLLIKPSENFVQVDSVKLFVTANEFVEVRYRIDRAAMGYFSTNLSIKDKKIKINFTDQGKRKTIWISANEN